MNESLITVRYATALFSVAKDRILLQVLKDDVELISDASRHSADFIRMLNSPVVKPSDKVKVLRAIFGERVSTLTMNFLELTVKNNRESFIPAVCRVVIDLVKKEQNIKTAVITTARKVDKSTREKAEKVLEAELGARVELTAKTNEKIIGGLVLRIDDRQYDASIATKLDRLKKEFLKTQL